MTSRRGASPPLADARIADLDQALRRETLNSERLRALGVAGFMSALLVISAVFRLSALGRASRPPVGDMPAGSRPPTIELYFVAYLLMAAGDMWLITQAQRSPRKRLFGAMPYISAFIETLLPTVLLASQTAVMPEAAFTAWTTKLYYLFIILSTLRLNFWLSLFTGAISSLQLLAVAAVVLPHALSPASPESSFQGQLFHAALLLLAGTLAGAVGWRLRRQLINTLVAVSARDHVTELFGQHVSAPVAERLLESSAAAAAEVGEVCVLFLDIRDFTAWARERPPDEVMTWLDQTFTVLVEIVDAHHGFVSKFLGDGFMALFGGPVADPEAVPHAVAAAKAMLAALERGNQPGRGPARVGIGIHVGPAVAGTVGSPRRKEYTVIGDTVNQASRIEALNKEFGSQLLISQQVRDAAGDAAQGAVPLGPVTLRGYAEPVPIWRLG